MYFTIFTDGYDFSFHRLSSLLLYGDTAELLYLTQLVGKGIHIPAFLFVGDFGVDLCRADIRMPEHLGECFDGDSVGQADFRRHGMAAGMKILSI